MAEEAIIKLTARALRATGAAGVKGSTLKYLTECELGSPLTTVDFNDALSFLENGGYAGKRVNQFGFIIYWLTEAGKNWIV